MSPQFLYILLLTLCTPSLAVRAIINSVTYSGRSCPPGTVSTFIDSSTTSLQHVIDGFKPPLPSPATSITDSISNCTVQLNITIDEPCWRIYTNPLGMDVRGYMPMPENTSVTVASRFQWLADRVTGANELTVQGPLPDYFSKHSDNISDNDIMSPCNGGLFSITYIARARTTSSKPIGMIPVDPLPGEQAWAFSTSLQLARCRETCSKR